MEKNSAAPLYIIIKKIIRTTIRKGKNNIIIFGKSRGAYNIYN